MAMSNLIAAVAAAAVSMDMPKRSNVSRQDICGSTMHEKAPPKRGSHRN
jgi:hypothetical protein